MTLKISRCPARYNFSATSGKPDPARESTHALLLNAHQAQIGQFYTFPGRAIRSSFTAAELIPTIEFVFFFDGNTASHWFAYFV